MKHLIPAILLTVWTGLTVQAQEADDSKAPGYLNETKYYVFYNHYWLNLHHFLQQEALTSDELKKSTIPETVWNGLSGPDREKLRRAIDYYNENLLEKDLRMSDYQTDFKHWIITQNEERLSSQPDEFKAHLSRLLSVEKVYRENFWPQHSTACKQILEANLPLIKASESDLVDSLTTLVREFWQRDKIRVDISYYAKSTRRNMRNRPYTSLFPTHVVMNSSEGADEPRGNWIELLYHESSHHLIGSVSGFVGGTISDVADAAGKKAPRSLWHAYLFYFSGKLAVEVLKAQGFREYEMYMIRNKVFSWYLPHLEKHLPLYMNREITLKDATARIIADYNAAQ